MVPRLPDSWSTEIQLEILIFEERGKPEYKEKSLSEQGREPTTNSTHIWRRRKILRCGSVVLPADLSTDLDPSYGTASSPNTPLSKKSLQKLCSWIHIISCAYWGRLRWSTYYSQKNKKTLWELFKPFAFTAVQLITNSYLLHLFSLVFL